MLTDTIMKNIKYAGRPRIAAAMPYLEGKNLIGITDLQGKAFIRDQIAAAMTDGSAWLEHQWYLPGSNRPARKQTFVRKVQRDARTFIVGSRLYDEQGPAAGRQHADIVKTSWQSLTQERLTDAVSRQVIHGDKATLARLTLKAGGGVARHYHANEEYAWVVSGALEYRLDDRTVLVRAGEVIVVPSNVPHAIVAPEESICIYFFVHSVDDVCGRACSRFSRLPRRRSGHDATPLSFVPGHSPGVAWFDA